MKTIKFLFIAILSVMFLKISSGQPFTKEISKEYTVNSGKYFQISNQFGDIHIENWEQDKLSIVVTISTDAKDQEAANKFFEKINIAFNETDTLISAITELEKNLTAKDFSIDYKIFMPDYLRIDLLNSYGDVYIQELTGKSMISVKYGNLKADKLIFGDTKPRTTIILAYSGADIEECDWLILLTSFSEIEISKSTALIIKSKYSEFNIENANSIVSELKYDTPFEIGSIENFVCDGEYTDINIEKLTSKLEVDLKYSDLQIDEVSENFLSLDFILKYGNAEVDINENASYIIDAESEYGNVSVDGNDNLSVTSGTTVEEIKGTVGKNANTASKVTIDSKYSDVELK